MFSTINIIMLFCQKNINIDGKILYDSKTVIYESDQSIVPQKDIISTSLR